MTNDQTKSVAARRLTFHRSHRLSGKLAFAGVYDAKVKESRGPLAMFSLPNELKHPRLGLSVSRRVGTAPVRNRIKRLLRESFRLHPFDLPRGYDLVIAVRPHTPMALGEYQKLMGVLIQKSHAAWERRKPIAVMNESQGVPAPK
jgi:ribonuclease P protein component